MRMFSPGSLKYFRNSLKNLFSQVPLVVPLVKVRSFSESGTPKERSLGVL